MQIGLQDKVLGLDVITPFEKLLRIEHPDLMNLERLKYKGLKIVLECESNELVFEIVRRISERLDLLLIDFLFLLAESVVISIPLLLEPFSLLLQSHVEQHTCLLQYLNLFYLRVLKDYLRENLNGF